MSRGLEKVVAKIGRRRARSNSARYLRKSFQYSRLVSCSAETHVPEKIDWFLLPILLKDNDDYFHGWVYVDLPNGTSFFIEATTGEKKSLDDPRY